jgi:type II secretion system protein H
VRAKPAGNLSGFTLLEVLLVAAMVVLIASVGAGIWTGTYNRLLVEKAARDFVFAAKHARIAAIERGNPCKLILDAENGGFSLLVYGLDEQAGRTEQVALRDAYFKKPVKFPGNVRFEDIQITPIGTGEAAAADEDRTIVFSPNGAAQSAVVQIGDAKNHYTVSICAATGRARTHFGTAQGIETGTVDLDE